MEKSALIFTRKLFAAWIHAADHNVLFPIVRSTEEKKRRKKQNAEKQETQEIMGHSEWEMQYH